MKCERQYEAMRRGGATGESGVNDLKCAPKEGSNHFETILGSKMQLTQHSRTPCPAHNSRQGAGAAMLIHCGVAPAIEQIESRARARDEYGAAHLDRST